MYVKQCTLERYIFPQEANNLIREIGQIQELQIINFLKPPNLSKMQK